MTLCIPPCFYYRNPKNSGSVVLRADSGQYEDWYDLMRPWEHYVPVARCV